MGLSTISRAKRDQTWREDVITNGIGRVEGIAVDWIAGEKKGILLNFRITKRQFSDLLIIHINNYCFFNIWNLKPQKHLKFKITNTFET